MKGEHGTLVVRGGRVVDGTGGPARDADVLVRDGRIAEVAPRAAAPAGAKVVDAAGCIVTPGFVDVHTHYDAQVGWDPLLSSSCFHGVTSVVMGNCGMTFAPCRPDDRSYLAACMESVEDIPAASILDGLPWDWVTYGEYLASLDRRELGVNVGGMVGHGALRWWAMGERSLDPDADPTPGELDEMRMLVDEALAAGALGFSTSRTLRHKVPDGRYVPGTFAGADELLALASVLGERRQGVVEVAPRFDGEGPSEPRCRAELAWMREVSLRTGRPVTFNLTHTWANPEHHRLAVALAREANAAGAQVRPQTTARGIGVLFVFGTATPFDRHPSWRELRELAPAARLAAIRDGATRARLLGDAAGGPSAAELAGFHLTCVDGPHPRFDADPSTELPAAAAAQGVDVAACYLDALDRSEGRALVYWPILNQSMDAIREMLLDDTVVLGLADGGAHVGQILDASQPTWILSYWVREQQALPVACAVQRLTADGASMFGLAGRGTIEPGAWADLNVIDLDALALGTPEVAQDFPHGAARLVQRAEGYVATIVNGRVTLEDGAHTGELPGDVLRGKGAP